MLLRRQLKIGDSTLVECPDSCINEDVMIYGDL